MALVTRESLQALIDESFGPNGEVTEKLQHVVGRALVVLFERQTAAERQANFTNDTNGVGFTGADARSGCLTAKSYIKHGRLEDWQVLRWTKNCKNGQSRLTKYYKQLNEAAIKKAKENVSGLA